MSKLTNKAGLPKTIVEVLTRADYERDPKKYYVTELTDSPRTVQLRKRHGSEIVEDVSDKIWALLGNAVHYILEKVSDKNRFTEERLELNLLDRKITGRSDLLEEQENKLILSDYKISSTWTYIYGSNTQKWEEQLNIYDYMWYKQGFNIDELQVVLIMRDWSKGKARKDKEYPQVQIQVVKVKKWSHQEQEEFIKKHLTALIESENVTDTELPLCSETDRWKKETAFAVMKNKNKRAVRVLPTAEDAQRYLTGCQNKDSKSNYYIQERKGEDSKCKEYCHVCQWCNYYKEHYEQA